jgi:hypothetical protein
MSKERTGPPPPEKEAAAPVGEPGQRRDFDNGSDSQNYTSTPVALLPPNAAPQPMSFADLRRWGARAGIPVRATLWGAGRPDNALGSIVAHFDAPVPEWLIASAIERATHIIGAPNIDDYFATAAQIAAKGGRVLLIETSTGALLPGGAASDD